MRELKFRQYVNERFHYWGFLEEGVFTGPINPTDHSDMFTGMHDKNGVEIWEGDIIEIPAGHGGDQWFEKTKAEVRWDEEGAGFYPHNLFAKDGIVMQEVAGDEVEVIGNVHQHSHLLEEK